MSIFITRKFGARLANRELARSWSCLAEAGDERRRMKRIARRAMNRGLAKGYGSWLDYLDERKRLRRSARAREVAELEDRKRKREAQRAEWQREDAARDEARIKSVEFEVRKRLRKKKRNEGKVTLVAPAVAAEDWTTPVLEEWEGFVAQSLQHTRTHSTFLIPCKSGILLPRRWTPSVIQRLRAKRC